MSSHIVVGLGFGDEGKGACVDTILATVSNTSTCVVRFSGGQQCGHRVFTTPEIGHVHSSYGSGSLREIPTYISEHCSVYLPFLFRELDELKAKGFSPKMYIHPHAVVTFPNDLALNRQIHKFDKDNNTTGMGVGTTFWRNNLPSGKFKVMDLLNENYSFLFAKIRSLFRKSALDKETLQRWQDYREAFTRFRTSGEVQVVGYKKLQEFDNLVFEGSQGTLLDAEHGIFPNVTYANTTIRNAMEIIRNHVPTLYTKIYYCSRTYLTRHGDGWFPKKEQSIANPFEYNQNNPWQGRFKTAELDYSLLDYAIRVNDSYLKGAPSIRHLVFSCNDVVPIKKNNVQLTKLMSKHNISTVHIRSSHITDKNGFTQ